MPNHPVLTAGLQQPRQRGLGKNHRAGHADAPDL